MKFSETSSKIFLIVLGLLQFNFGFTQITKFENNLIKINDKVSRGQENEDQDSVNFYSEKFTKELSKFISNNPKTLEYKFGKLITSKACEITTSEDGLFRIYSWDTWSGGSMHFFENLFQFKSNGLIQTFKPKEIKEKIRAGISFSKIYTVQSDNKKIYLAIGNSIFSGISGSRTIQAFSIEKGKINDNLKIFKTKNKLLNKIEVEYDYANSYSDNKNSNEIERTSDLIEFDQSKNTIFIALISKTGKITNKNLVYKFDGQYFTFENKQ